LPKRKLASKNSGRLQDEGSRKLETDIENLFSGQMRLREIGEVFCGITDIRQWLSDRRKLKFRHQVKFATDVF